MRGYTQMAALKKPDPAIADFLRKIDAAGTLIQRQIEFMRMYQDLGVKAPDWFRIDDLVSSARSPDVSVTSTCGATEIFSDPMIVRVFFNLFDNAVRHGKTVTHITVRCEQGSENLVVTVEDNGVGIPPDEKLKIFEKGYGKHTGFGLFLVREILAITGISIHETGTPGKGARFEITVPKGAYRSGAD
jgi:signal transduction histidine kinase